MFAYSDIKRLLYWFNIDFSE